MYHPGIPSVDRLPLYQVSSSHNHIHCHIPRQNRSPPYPRLVHRLLAGTVHLQNSGIFSPIQESISGAVINKISFSKIIKVKKQQQKVAKLITVNTA